MKRLHLLFSALFIMSGLLLMGAGCASDPNVEGAKLDVRNKDYDRALQNLETALSKNPNNAEAYLIRGNVYMEKANSTTDLQQHSQFVNDMATAYSKAAELDPKLAADISQRLRLAYYNEFNKGIGAFNRGKDNPDAFREAVAYFGNAGKLGPDSSAAFINQGIALMNSGQDSLAVEPFTIAIAKGDDNPDTYIYLSEILLRHNRGEEAVARLEEAVAKHPQDQTLADQLKNAYVRANMLDRAESEFSKAVAAEPNNKLYRYNYGSLLLNANKYDAAIEQLLVAIQLDENYAAAQYNLGAAYINKAVDVNEAVQAGDDDLRAKRNSLSAAEIRTREADLDKLVAQRKELFVQAIPYLEKARTLMEAAGDDVSDVCRSLFQSYVQANQMDKAQTVQACAGQ